MNRLTDTLRHVVISPELLGILAVFCFLYFAPSAFDFPTKHLGEGIGFGLGAAGVASGCLAFCYQEGATILEPSGTGRVLLDWPGYFLLKNRVIASMCWCVFGVAGALAATWLVASGVGANGGAALLVASLLASVVSLASIALARLRIREILQANS